MPLLEGVLVLGVLLLEGVPWPLLEGVEEYLVEINAGVESHRLEGVGVLLFGASI